MALDGRTTLTANLTPRSVQHFILFAAAARRLDIENQRKHYTYSHWIDPDMENTPLLFEKYAD